MPELGVCLAPATIHPRSDFAGDAVATLTPGQQVRVLQARGTWCRVAAGDAEGFAAATSIARMAPAARSAYLAADRDLQNAPVEAAPSDRREASSGARAAAVARAWNLYGGLITQLAERIEVESAAAIAVLVVESSGHGFGPDGRVIIRFENHIFRRYLGAARSAEFDRHFQVGSDQPWMGHLYRRTVRDSWRPFHGSQALEWDALDVARSLDEGAALRSISMGLPQVMGFNHGMVGYADPAHMLAFMGADVRFQLLALFDFIRGGQAQSRAVTALRAGDYDTFASLYNGPGQARYYGDLIGSHVEAFRATRAASTSTRAKNPPAARKTGATAARVASGDTYEVRPGDTLGVIAGRFATTVDAISALNGIANPNLISVGQVLRLPATEPPAPPPPVPSAPPEDVDAEGTPRAGGTYIVRPGDTLGVIARAVGSSVPALAEANAIQDVNRIFPGQVLTVPAG